MKLILRLMIGLLTYEAAFISPIAEAAPASGEPIVIGANFALTGWAAPGGKSELNATTMAVEDINAAGGVKGRPLKLATEDNRSDFPSTVGVINKLLAVNKVPAILGPNYSEFAEIAAPMADRAKVPMLTATGYAPILEKGKGYSFTLLPGFSVHVKPLVDYIAQQKHTRITLLSSPSTYFDGLAEATRTQLEDHGVKLFRSASVLPTETDFKSVVERLKTDAVDGVIVFLQEGQSMATFLKQARDLHYAGKIYTNDISFDDVITKDWQIAEGTTFLSYHDNSSGPFIERYNKRFKEQPGLGAPRAYDAVFVLKAAMEQCGLAPSELAECLRKTKYKGVSGEIEFGPHGITTSTAPITRLAVVKGGKVQGLS